MNIQVWADVGGTFTDCLVHVPAEVSSASDARLRRRSLKLLSSGQVRVRCQPTADRSTWSIESAPGVELPGFWTGASVSMIDADGSRISLGRVVRQDLGSLEVSDPPTDPVQLARINSVPSVVMELDAGLESPVLATRILLGVPLSKTLPPVDVRLGTTRGTNALLTRQGARTGLLITRGFGDVLKIGEQDRPELFALAIKKHDPLTDRVSEIDERLDARGNILERLDRQQIVDVLQRWKSDGVESIAICFLHAHVNDQHERVAQEVAESIGFLSVSRSSEVAPLIKLGFRAETTTLDAYLNPILAGYVARVWSQFGGEDRCRFRLMTSGGNLVAPNAFRGRDSILSGPAGGVVGLGHVAQITDAESAIGLDMGGTSTDVSRFDGQVGRRFESRVAGTRVMTPMMDIETVAAGGGSICQWTEEGRLAVGPQSAGADPGPACYGRGGPLTVTDVNLLLGRIPVAKFPFPLQPDSSRDRLEQLLDQIKDRRRFASPYDLAEGFLEIAITQMAEAVRTVSTTQGRDVREMALVGFGGAAGQHLCRVANALGMSRILDHPDASVLSAVGIGLAPIGRTVTRGVYMLLAETSASIIDQVTDALRVEAEELMEGEPLQSATTDFAFQIDLRYSGTESSLSLPLYPLESADQRFHQAHRQAYGYSQEERAIELVSVRCDATKRSTQDYAAPSSTEACEPESETKMWYDGDWIPTRLLDRHSLRRDETVDGPAMIASENSTLIVEPGWRARLIAEQTIELTPFKEHQAANKSTPTSTQSDDPVLLEVVARRWQGIADSMGEVLRRTSISVNVKERRDYSCAIFRGDGSLVANAPHVPVHLGAMGHTVRHLMKVFPEMSDGDCYLSNDPFFGGSHLPDVTAVTPVFCSESKKSGKADFFVASRAHHAEIGGRTPGSMPPDATSLAEEGVVIRDFPLVRFGEQHFDRLRDLLTSGDYPSRCVSENIADIQAQQAAGVHGCRALAQLAGQYSPKTVDDLMGRLLHVASEGVASWIRTLPTERMRFEDQLDDGTHIHVSLQRNDDRLRIAFETGNVHPHGFNATPAIVAAAVLYMLRTVSGSNLPLCEGVLRQIDLEIPKGLLDPPFDPDPRNCAAVVAGNVETSQRIVDTLLGALGSAAASQGTMNNVLFGDETFGYYETIGGGSGATADHPGASAVHTHMTNTRITDPEVLEWRLPIRLRQFAIRTDSGGEGRCPGGDGIIREFELLKPLVVSLITSRRTSRPYGLAGGDAGQSGLNQWIKRNETIDLPATVTFQADAGDRLLIATPGGGGWGKPQKTTSKPE